MVSFRLIKSHSAAVNENNDVECTAATSRATGLSDTLNGFVHKMLAATYRP
jgi:hypothetical protein